MALCLAIVGGYWSMALRQYLASRASTADREQCREAQRLEPWNADHPYWLGREALYARQDFPSAITDFQRATSLDPYVPRYWLDLATAYVASGRAAESRAAVERAFAAGTHNLDTVEEIATYYLAQGDRSDGFRELRLILDNEPWSTPEVLDLAWRGSHDAGLILSDALPPNANEYGEFLHFLGEQKEYDAQDLAWSRLIALHQPYPAAKAMPYLDSLLERKKVSEARQAWLQMAQLDPALKAYQSTDSLVVNGGFEEDPLNDGFDWRYAQSPPAIQMELDTLQAHSGMQSLAISLDAVPLGDAGIYQLVPVEPGRHYHVSAWVRAVDLESASGPRLVVEDAYTRAALYTGDAFDGTTGWRHLEGDFTAGPETQLITLRFGREMPEKRIRGRFWLDDVSITDASAATVEKR